MNHENWTNKQTLASHKAIEIQGKQQMERLSKYDWQSVSISLKSHSQSIFEPFDKMIKTRKSQTRNCLKRLLVRKYPNRLAN